MSNSARFVAVVGFIILTLGLTVARVVEIDAGHTPTSVLNAAFSASVTATLGALAYYMYGVAKS